jgi:hypothetical protein
MPMNNAASMNVFEDELTNFLAVLKKYEAKLQLAVKPVVMDDKYARSKPTLLQYSEPAVITQTP